MRHQDLSINHRLESWVYANAAARMSATGFVTGDIGRVAYQSDTGEYFRLTSPTPTWTFIPPSNTVLLQTAYTIAAGTAAATPGVMTGLSGIITPVRSGKIFVTASGWVTNSAAGGAIQASLRYGTTPAPGVGAASTGTSIGSICQRLGAGYGADMRTPFSLSAVTGALTIGTAYWFDLAYFASGGGTANVAFALAGYELP